MEGRVATHGSLYARRRAAAGPSARFAQGPDETRTMSQSQSEIPRPRSRRRNRHVSASRRRYKEETGRSASIDWSALEDVAAVPDAGSRRLFECEAFEEEREAFLARLYSVCPPARQLSDEGRCRWVMGDELPREIENSLYRYLIAISKLRLGILTEQGEGS